ncbi:putative ABC transporter permease [Syntrophomonas erecta]
MRKRFIIYGMAGWITEVVFTGMGSLVMGAVNLAAYTYLWMFPIYGMGVLLEPIHDHIRSISWIVRGFIWVGVIFTIEYLAGWILQVTIGTCPWDYSGRTIYSVDGFIRLDFIPVWFAAGLIFEQLHDFLDQTLSQLK